MYGSGYFSITTIQCNVISSIRNPNIQAQQTRQMTSEYIAHQHVNCIHLSAVLEMVNLYMKLARDCPQFTCSTSTRALGMEKGEGSSQCQPHTLQEQLVWRIVELGVGSRGKRGEQG